MPLPVTDSNKGFEANKTVQVGDPTEAAADHDALAENTDWLREAKMTGWRGSCYADGPRASKKNSAGSIWVAKAATEPGTAVTLCDVSAVGMPPETEGFRHRLLFLNLVAVVVDGYYVEDKDVEAFFPGGAKDRFLGGDSGDGINGEIEGENWARSTGASNPFPIRMEPLYAGPGQSSRTADEYVRTFVWNDPLEAGNDVTFFFWVDATSGDLKFAWTRQVAGGSHPPAEVAIHGVVFYGPAWEETE